MEKERVIEAQTRTIDGLTERIAHLETFETTNKQLAEKVEELHHQVAESQHAQHTIAKLREKLEEQIPLKNQIKVLELETSRLRLEAEQSRSSHMSLPANPSTHTLPSSEAGSEAVQSALQERLLHLESQLAEEQAMSAKLHVHIADLEEKAQQQNASSTVDRLGSSFFHFSHQAKHVGVLKRERTRSTEAADKMAVLKQEVSTLQLQLQREKDEKHTWIAAAKKSKELVCPFFNLMMI